MLSPYSKRMVLMTFAVRREYELEVQEFRGYILQSLERGEGYAFCPAGVADAVYAVQGLADKDVAQGLAALR